MPQAEEAKCSCTKDLWPLVLFMLSLVVVFLICLSSVLTLMNLSGRFQLPTIILSLFLIVFALLILLVEVRRFQALRSVCFKVLKYFYFLVNYHGRALYYIFVGSIMLDASNVLFLLVGIGAMVLGVLNGAVHLVIGLPEYQDAEMDGVQGNVKVGHAVPSGAAMFA